MDNSRRLVRTQITAGFLITLMTTRNEYQATCVDGLPPGCYLMGLRVSSPDYVEITVQHDDFDIVPEGEPIPYVQITCHTRMIKPELLAKTWDER